MVRSPTRPQGCPQGCAPLLPRPLRPTLRCLGCTALVLVLDHVAVMQAYFVLAAPFAQVAVDLRARGYAGDELVQGAQRGRHVRRPQLGWHLWVLGDV